MMIVAESVLKRQEQSMALPKPYRPDLTTYLGHNYGNAVLPAVSMTRADQGVGILLQDVYLSRLQHSQPLFGATRDAAFHLAVRRALAPRPVLLSACHVGSPWTNVVLRFDLPTPEFGPLPRALLLDWVFAWSMGGRAEAEGMAIWGDVVFWAGRVTPVPELEARVRPLLRSAPDLHAMHTQVG